jgi:CheY-like chemotaxis protein
MNQTTRLNILVAEDNVFYQELIRKELEPITLSIRFFARGEDLAEEIKNATPDILVLDYNLDGEMNGLDTLKACRVYFPDIYALVFSSEHILNTEDNLALYGNFDYVEKNSSAISHLKMMICSSPVFLQKAVENKSLSEALEAIYSKK